MTADTPTSDELDAYRAQARAWLETNLDRRPPGVADRTVAATPDTTPEQLASQRALQRRLYEAGYSGITWPQEYGGQGRHRAYEQAFQREARA